MLSVALREVEYCLRARGAAPQLPLRITRLSPKLVVETRVAHLDERGRVWRLLDVFGPTEALRQAQRLFESEAGRATERRVLGLSPGRLVLWYKYRPPPAPGFSNTALAFRRLGRDLVLTDRTEGDRLTIRLVTRRGDRLPAFLGAVERASGRDFVFELLYAGPPRAIKRPDLAPEDERLLRAALEDGFFEVPRGTDVRRLAARLGLSASAVSARLRQAQARLVRAHLTPS